MSLVVSTMSPIVAGATTLPVVDLQISPDVQVGNFRHSGNEFPSVGVVPSARPTVRFKTPFRIGYSTFGLKMTLVSTFSVFFSTFSNGIKQGGASHYALTLNTTAGQVGKAAVYITGASVAQNGLFMAECEAILLATSDGRTHPFNALAGGATLPTLGSEPQLDTLGPVTFGGTTPGTPIEGVRNHGFSQNASIYAPINDGDTFPRTCTWMGADPQIQIDHEDPISALTAIGLMGATTATFCGIFARGIDPTTQLTQTTGVQILQTAGRLLPGPLSFDFGRANRMGLIHRSLVPTANGPQTHPFAVTLGAALPALP